MKATVAALSASLTSLSALSATVGAHSTTLGEHSTTLGEHSAALSCESGRRLESTVVDAREVAQERNLLSNYLDQNPALAAVIEVDELHRHLIGIEQYFGQPAPA